jgi:hypothetical protein
MKRHEARGRSLPNVVCRQDRPRHVMPCKDVLFFPLPSCMCFAAGSEGSVSLLRPSSRIEQQPADASRGGRGVIEGQRSCSPSHLEISLHGTTPPTQRRQRLDPTVQAGGRAGGNTMSITTYSPCAQPWGTWEVQTRYIEISSTQPANMIGTTPHTCRHADMPRVAAAG